MRARRIALVLAVIALGAMLWLLPLRAWTEELLAWIAAHRGVAWIAFIAFYVMATVALVSGALLTLAAGAIFGLGTGVVIVSVASVLAATAAFVIGRTVARDWVGRRIAAWPHFRALDRVLAERGFWIVLLTRLSPAFPFVLLNYAYGITAVRPRDYVLGSWIGMFPGTVLYVYAGSVAASLGAALSGEIDTGGSGRVLLVVGLLATLAVTVLVTRLASRSLDREIAAGGGRAA